MSNDIQPVSPYIRANLFELAPEFGFVAAYEPQAVHRLAVACSRDGLAWEFPIKNGVEVHKDPDEAGGHFIYFPGICTWRGLYVLAYQDGTASETFGLATSPDLEHWTHVARIATGLTGLNVQHVCPFFDNSSQMPGVVFRANSAGGGAQNEIYAMLADVTDPTLATWNPPTKILANGGANDFEFPNVFWHGPQNPKLIYYETGGTYVHHADPGLIPPFSGLFVHAGIWYGTTDLTCPTVLRVGPYGTPSLWRFIGHDTGAVQMHHAESYDDGVNWNTPANIPTLAMAYAHVWQK